MQNLLNERTKITDPNFDLGSLPVGEYVLFLAKKPVLVVNVLPNKKENAPQTSGVPDRLPL